MRMLSYYILHTFANQVRKLLRTWMLMFFLICALLGGLIGFGAALLSEPDDGAAGEPAEESFSLAEFLELSEDDTAELVAGGVILAIFLFGALRADKNGSRIFLPADVNLLFPSPMKPQAVLMFRLTTQLGLALLASVYLLLQLPTLISALGLSAWAAAALVAAWGLTVAVGKAAQMLLYTVGATHPGWRTRIRWSVYALTLLIAGSFMIYRRTAGLDWIQAAAAFFNSPLSRYIPFWGWLKGLIVFSARGDTAGTLTCLAATLLGGGALFYILWHIRADFYEDAMARSEETAELLDRAQSDRTGGLMVSRRKKDRSERLRRDDMRHGGGANVFFHKTMYNRFRFAHLGFLTKTAETYLVIAAGASVLCRYVIGSTMIYSVAITLAALVFFRSLGNPLAPDIESYIFRLVPESTYAKLFWSLLGGTVCCLLDLLPAMLAAVLILGEDPLAALVWLPLILSVDLYSTVVGTFIGLSVPVSAGRLLKQLTQILFIYFGLLPDAAVIAAAFMLGLPAGGFVGVVLVNLLLAGIFFAVTPRFIDPGERPDAAA